MTISETVEKCKDFLKENEKDIFLAALIILVGFFSFGLGRLSKIMENKTPVTLQNATLAEEAVFDFDGQDADENLANVKNVISSNTQNDVNKEKNFVASKNGTKYYFVWCGGVNNIKQENKIYFATKEEAQSAGYAPAKNCKGLQ